MRECLEAYGELDDTQKAELATLLEAPPLVEVKNLMATTSERGMAQGEARGEAMLNELAGLFAGLSARADDLRRGRTISDAMFCAATYGLWRLPASEYPAADFYSSEERRRRAKKDENSGCGSGSCGSSCSSSDGGGGGDGGGGCGGGCGGG